VSAGTLSFSAIALAVDPAEHSALICSAISSAILACYRAILAAWGACDLLGAFNPLAAKYDALVVLDVFDLRHENLKAVVACFFANFA
jgi:hypothetical protein